MRNSSPYPLGVWFGIFLFAFALQAIPVAGQLWAQGLRKRKPLPDNIQDPTEIDRFLTNLDVDEVLGYERVEAVCIHFLKRSDVPEFARREAIERLAEIKHTEPVTVLLPRIERLDTNDKLGDADRRTLDDLASLLPQQSPDALIGSRERVVKLAVAGQRDTTRQSAMAALVAADRSCDAVWALASESSQSLLDVLRSVPQLPSDVPRANLFRDVQPLLRQPAKPEIQAAAIQAVALLDDNGRETFETLSDFIQQGVHPEACVRAICNIPSDQWTDRQRRPLADRLISRLAETPIQQRTSREARDAIKLIKKLASLMPSQDEAEVRSELDKHRVDIHRMAAVEGSVCFDPDVLVMKRRRAVQLLFHNKDVEPHKLVVMPSSAAHETIRRGRSPAENPTDQPPAEQILAATEVVSPGKYDALTFVAPDHPGIYVAVCTLPDHWPRLYAAIVIVDDVDAYRAEHATLPNVNDVLEMPPEVERE